MNQPTAALLATLLLAGTLTAGCFGGARGQVVTTAFDPLEEVQKLLGNNPELGLVAIGGIQTQRDISPSVDADGKLDFWRYSYYNATANEYVKVRTDYKGAVKESHELAWPGSALQLSTLDPAGLLDSDEAADIAVAALPSAVAPLDTDDTVIYWLHAPAGIPRWEITLKEASGSVYSVAVDGASGSVLSILNMAPEVLAHRFTASLLGYVQDSMSSCLETGSPAFTAPGLNFTTARFIAQTAAEAWMPDARLVDAGAKEVEEAGIYPMSFGQQDLGSIVIPPDLISSDGRPPVWAFIYDSPSLGKILPILVYENIVPVFPALPQDRQAAAFWYDKQEMPGGLKDPEDLVDSITSPEFLYPEYFLAKGREDSSLTGWSFEARESPGSTSSWWTFNAMTGELLGCGPAYLCE